MLIVVMAKVLIFVLLVRLIHTKNKKVTDSFRHKLTTRVKLLMNNNSTEAICDKTILTGLLKTYFLSSLKIIQNAPLIKAS